MTTEEEKTLTQAGLFVGFLCLVIGWYVVISDIDLLFWTGSPVVSEPFFVLEVALALVLLMTGVWLSYRYWTVSRRVVTYATQETLQAERD